MSANGFTIETGEGAIHIEVKINAVRVFTIQYDGESGLAEIVLDPDEARELARMLNIIATVAEGNK